MQNSKHFEIPPYHPNLIFLIRLHILFYLFLSIRDVFYDLTIIFKQKLRLSDFYEYPLTLEYFVSLCTAM